MPFSPWKPKGLSHVICEDGCAALFWLAIPSLLSPPPWPTSPWLGQVLANGPLTRASYQIREIADCACAGNAGNVFPQPPVSDLDMHHGTCVTDVSWCMSGSLTRSGGQMFPAFPAHAHPQFYVSGKRPTKQNSYICYVFFHWLRPCSAKDR